MMIIRLAIALLCVSGPGCASVMDDESQKVGGLFSPQECEAFKAETTCSWTTQWSCPNSQQPGHKGWAKDDKSKGFYCCCEAPLNTEFFAGKTYSLKDPHCKDFCSASLTFHRDKTVDFACSTLPEKECNCPNAPCKGLPYFATPWSGLTIPGFFDVGCARAAENALPPKLAYNISTNTFQIAITNELGRYGYTSGELAEQEQEVVV